MRWDMGGELGKKLRAWFGRYKLVLLVLAAGVVLLLWPSGRGAPSASGAPAGTEGPGFDVEALERKLERVLSKIDGAGEVSVALNVKDGVEQIYAADSSRAQDGESREEQTQTVVISTGSGTEEVVPVRQHWPDFQGAVVVCGGGGEAEIRLLMTQAVSALTGLGADRITVCKAGH